MGLGGFARDAGVKNHRIAIAVDGAATGPNTGFAALRGGPESDRQPFPFYQVTAANVSPILGAIAVTEGIQLIEKVIVAVVIDRAIWIVHPLGRRNNVEDRARGICLGARGGGLQSRHGLADGGISCVSAPGPREKPKKAVETGKNPEAVEHIARFMTTGDGGRKPAFEAS